MSLFRLSIQNILFFYLALSCPVLIAQSRSKVILSLPITGAAASYGNELRGAVEFFSSKLKIDADFILIDDKCSPKEALTAVKEALSRGKISALIGAPCSGVVLAIAPLLYEKDIPLISFGAMAAAISELPGKVYRVGISDGRIAATLLPFVKGRQVVSFVEQTEFAESTYRQLKNLSSDSFQIEPIVFVSDTSDFRSLALKAIKASPDLIFISAQSGVTLANIVKALSLSKSTIPVLTGVFGESPIFSKLAMDRSMQVTYSASATRQYCQELAKNDAIQVFEKFEKEYGTLQSNDFTLISAEIGLHLLSDLLNVQADKVNNLIINSLCGPVSFLENGDLDGLDLKPVILDLDGDKHLLSE